MLVVPASTSPGPPGLLWLSRGPRLGDPGLQLQEPVPSPQNGQEVGSEGNTFSLTPPEASSPKTDSCFFLFLDRLPFRIH